MKATLGFLGANITATTALVQALLGVLVVFGMKLTLEQVGALMTFTSTILSFVAVRQPVPVGKTAAKKVAGVAFIGLIASGAVGCSSLLHFKDPSIEDRVDEYCGKLGNDRRAEMQSRSVKTGIPLADILKAFQVACVARALTGLKEAPEAGMAGARAKAP